MFTNHPLTLTLSRATRSRASRVFSLAIFAALAAVDASPAAAQAPGIDPVLVWCRSSLEALNVAETRANEARYFSGPDAELAAMEAGLAQAEQNSFPYGTGPLTLSAIRRGRVYASAMRTQYGTTVGGSRTTAHFLHQYYGFIRKVANEIDIPFYIPRTYCNGCGPTIPDYGYELERRNVDFASEQLKLALQKMATEQGGQVFPIGPATLPSDGFLTVLKLATEFVVEDLTPSLYGSPFACLIARLRQVSTEAAAHLAPGSNEWQKAYGVRKLHAETAYFARELFQPANCPNTGWPSNWPSASWPQQNPASNWPQQQQWPQTQWPNPADNPRPGSYGPVTHPSYDQDVYKRILGHSVPHNCHQIKSDWAERISRSVYSGEYRVETFLSVYDRTCSEESASQIAYDSYRGTIDFDAWITIYGYSGSRKCGAIGLKDATEIARRCARREVQAREFMELYSRTCNVSQALNIGGRY